MNKETGMDCREAIRGRRSIRRFKETPLGKELVDELLGLARMAPSAGNLQSRDFVVVTDKKLKRKLAASALDQSFIEQAPVVIVAVANIDRASRRYGSRGELYAIQDASASVMTLLIAAQSMGIGSCWVGSFDEIAVSEHLVLPYGTKPVVIVPIGLPDESPSPPPKIEASKNIHRETW